jgi:SPP1 gp7 family putative phage head morphogenesis protein
MADNANTKIYDRSVDRSAMLRLYEKRVGSKVDAILDEHKIKVPKLIENSKLNSKEFKDNLSAIILDTYQKAHTSSKTSLLDLVNSQTSYTVQTLDSALGKIWRTERPTRRIAEEIVLEKPLYSNTTLAQGWAGIAISERKRLEAIIRKGLAEGLTEEQIARLVREGAAFKISRNQALGLVTTAVTSVYAQVDHAVYKANAQALQGWQYVAVLDSRTTPLCASRDGHIYPIEDTRHLPPAHWHCRSTTVPIVKSFEQFGEITGLAQIRQKNFENLSLKQRQWYDGQSPLKESYDTWLRRQSTEVQLRHLGDMDKVAIFNKGDLKLSKFTNEEGKSIGIKELNRLSDSGYGVSGDTKRFAKAKEKLDSLSLPVETPDQLIKDKKLQKTLKEYYLLQSGELDGTLSLTNYRGTLLHNKKNTKQRVLASPPSEENLKFNPITSRYEDARMYQPNKDAFNNAYRLVRESDVLTNQDKEFIISFVDNLEDSMGINERSVVTENLRILFTRYRENGESWGNFKAVVQGQIKFDVMNVSDYIETQIRKDSDLLLKLKQANYIDPILGPVQLQELHDNFIDNIFARNTWEDRVAPKIAKRLRNILDYKIPYKIRSRVEDWQMEEFYLKFARRLSLADSPDRDQLAVSLGRDLYNLANYRGSRNEWYNLGKKILDDANKKGFYELETFGVQKRRMKSRLSGQYFGQYYDTFSVNLRITDPRIQAYSKLQRKVDVGLRLGVTEDRNRLKIREGYKTYFDRYNRDTRIPITSTDSFRDFPEDLIDRNMADALNWTANAKYKIDPEFHNFIEKLLYFEDDKGKAKYYNELNKYREYMVERGDAYERIKAMRWLREKDTAFSNHPFLDHRARIYERGMIGPQSGETFRPFLNTAVPQNFSVAEFYNLQDQVGGLLGGLSDYLEGRYNSLSVTGRQSIAEHWRADLVKIGNHMLRAKPNDIRKVLDSDLLSRIDGEDQGKVLRLAMELAKIDNHLSGDYSAANLTKLKNYKISVALEQDASSSGAQIIALTTKNKQLAQLSNVVPTDQKRRLYDEIAHTTFNDPRFKVLNERLGLTEKDLRKAAKAQNMVTFYGAGERTGILNVEGKLAKVLGKDEGRLVVKTSDRDKVLNEISARMARYEKWDPYLYEELKALRQDVKDIFNKGLNPGADIMEQLYFLEPKTRDLLEKMSRQYVSTVTPDDFKLIGQIMSENLREQVPVLKDFTRFFGRLAEDYVTLAKPSQSDLDFSEILKTAVFGQYKAGKRLPKWLSRTMGIKDEAIRDKILRRIPGWVPGSNLDKILFGVKSPKNRRTGFKILNYSILGEDITKGIEIFYPNKLPKKWTNVPWKNFDGKTIEQNFTQVFEERLNYKDKDGNWVTNILQVPQKTDPTWWDEFRNHKGKINDIVDASKARTAFAVNGNHSNDAVIVKRFHMWGKDHGIETSTVHDAFFTNAAQMLESRWALRGIYADMATKNVIQDTLDEMYARGLPREVYLKYLNEAKDIGLIPVPGRSIIGGKVLTKDDILTKEDILANIPTDFKKNLYWYGIG